MFIIGLVFIYDTFMKKWNNELIYAVACVSKSMKIQPRMKKKIVCTQGETIQVCNSVGL